MDAHKRLHDTDALAPVARCGEALDQVCENLGLSKPLDDSSPVERRRLYNDIEQIKLAMVIARVEWAKYLSTVLSPHARFMLPIYIKAQHTFEFRSTTPFTVEVWGLEALPVL